MDRKGAASVAAGLIGGVSLGLHAGALDNPSSACYEQPAQVLSEMVEQQRASEYEHESEQQSRMGENSDELATALAGVDYAEESPVDADAAIMGDDLGVGPADGGGTSDDGMGGGLL